MTIDIDNAIRPGANGSHAEQTALPKDMKPVDLVHLSRQTFGSKDLENELLGRGCYELGNAPPST